MENKSLDIENRIKLFTKISNVRKSISSFLKKGKDDNGGLKYGYVKSSQVLMNVYDYLNDNSLLLYPKVLKQEVASIEIEKYNTYSKQLEKKIQYQTKLDIFYTWVDCDTGYEYQIDWNCGQGFDDFEKGVGKALTYAEKYFILKFFNIATDKDDPDEVANKKLDKQEKEKSTPPAQALTFDSIKKELEISKSYDELMKIYYKFKPQITDKNLNQKVVDFCTEFKKNLEVKNG